MKKVQVHRVIYQNGFVLLMTYPSTQSFNHLNYRILIKIKAMK